MESTINGNVFHFTGEYNGKEGWKVDVPENIVDISFFLSPATSGCKKYKEGYYLGTQKNRYKYFVGFTYDMSQFGVRLGKKFVIHPDTEVICSKAFYQCYTDGGKFIIPDKVKIIGKRAFWGVKFDEVVIPEGCTTVLEEAFYDTRIKTIVIPDSVENIGKGAFPKQKNSYTDLSASPAVLGRIGNVPLIEHFQQYLDSGERTADADKKWLDEILKIKESFVKTSLSGIHIKSLLFAFEYKLFKNSDADRLLEIAGKYKNNELMAAALELSNNISEKKKASDAIKKEEKLLGIRPLSVADIKKLWNYRADEDGNITLLRYLGNEDSPSIPSKVGTKPVTRIGEKAFICKTFIISVHIPEGVVAIGKNAFFGCSNLMSIDIPDTVCAVGEDAFENCTALENIPQISICQDSAYVSGQLDYCSLDAIKSEWQFSVDQKTSACRILKYTGQNTRIEIPTTILGCPVTEISAYCFSTGYSNRDPRHGTGPQQKHNKTIVSVTIPASVKYIGTCAFSGCRKIKEIKISGDCKVSANAFDGCNARIEFI